MSRTSHVTIPQKPKTRATRGRFRALQQRDRNVGLRGAGAADKRYWGELRHRFADRTGGWGTPEEFLDEILPEERYDLAPERDEVDERLLERAIDELEQVLSQLIGLSSFEEEVMPCGCTGTCEYLDTLDDFNDYDLVDRALDDPYSDFLDEPEDDDPNRVDDFGGYGRLHGAYLVNTGSGFGLDAVFGEGYRGGNCGYSVKTRP